MRSVSSLVEQVALGQHPDRVLSSVLEDDTSSWKPGDPVPKGYRVVFGKLVKKSDASGSNPHSDKAHKLSTKAFSHQHKADTKPDPDGYHSEDAFHAHVDAAAAHRAAARKATNPVDADAHKQAAAVHSQFVKAGFTGVPAPTKPLPSWGFKSDKDGSE